MTENFRKIKLKQGNIKRCLVNSNEKLQSCLRYLSRGWCSQFARPLQTMHTCFAVSNMVISVADIAD